MSQTSIDLASQRIAKVIAAAGLCSRREAERWIAAGRVSVNGNVLKTPAITVMADDEILVDGKLLPQAAPPRLFCYHKPVGLVTTHKDEQGRKTVFGALPSDLSRLISVGRLDLNSEGLLLLTTSGSLARTLELPATGLPRRYRVRVYGDLSAARLSDLTQGITVDGVTYGPVQATVLEAGKGRNHWLSVTLHEGKNREIRKVMGARGLQVSRLIREAYGPFTLGNLSRGGITEVPREAFERFLL